MNTTIKYDPKVHTVTEVFELERQGVIFTCPKCDSELKVVLNLEEARRQNLRPGIYCPRNNEHVFVTVAPISVQALSELDEIRKTRGWPPDCTIVSHILSDVDPEGRWHELELVRMGESGFNLSHIKRGPKTSDYEESSEFYETLNEISAALETNRSADDAARSLETELLKFLRARSRLLVKSG